MIQRSLQPFANKIAQIELLYLTREEKLKEPEELKSATKIPEIL